MQDLNATLFYKAKFTARANDPSIDILWTLVCEIRSWMLWKWNTDEHQLVKKGIRAWTRFKFGGKFYDQEQTNHIYGESARYVDKKTGRVSWACKIVENKDPSEGYAPREWTTEIGYQSIDDTSAVISYVVTYNDMPGYIGLCEEPPPISVPRVIRSLLSHDKITCFVGSNRISLEPIWLNTGDYPSFEKEVFNQNREVPIIYISPCNTFLEGNSDLGERSERAILLVNPFDLAKSVAGNAIVYCSNQMPYSDEMRYYIDSRYGCAGGAIRIYRSLINTDDPKDYYRHRYIPASFIVKNGENKVLEILHRAFAQDVYYYETMFRLENCKELIDNEIREEAIRTFRAKSETEVNEAYEEFVIESDLRKEAERKAREFSEDNRRLKSDIFNLQSQVEALRGTANLARQIESASQGVRNISEYPSTPQAIAKYFETVFPDRIVFTERAIRSMEDCITKNDFLWEVFFHIAVDLFDLIHENPAQAYKEFTARTGWECARGAGTMTRLDRDLIKQYIDTFDGQEINIEAHIKNGNKDTDPKSVRIYFAYEPQITERIIIGHCGKHIDNYSTRKIK